MCSMTKTCTANHELGPAEVLHTQRTREVLIFRVVVIDLPVCIHHLNEVATSI